MENLLKEMRKSKDLSLVQKEGFQYLLQAYEILKLIKNNNK